MERLLDVWYDLSGVASQQKACSEMQEAFWRNPSYVPLGLWYQPTGYRADLQDIRDGWPQFYGVRRV
jgi:peptide/nickel transport system substrate-binding protein